MPRSQKSMRKEIVFAIVAGVFFGLLVAFGIWRANSTLKNGKAAVTENKKNETENIDETPTLSGSQISIAKPLSNQVSSVSSLQVTGLTNANSYVVISTKNKDFVTKSDESGEFGNDIELSPGINIISATSFEQSGQKNTRSTLVVYSSEFQEPEKVEAEENVSTQSADDIRNKVQQKVNEVLANPISFVGSITDISENTIQISNFTVEENGDEKQGEIKLISINESTAYVDIKDKTKEIKVSDIAIGDFIAALGYKNENNVLSAKRILVTTKPEQQNHKPELGMISEVKGKDISFKTPLQTFSLKFGKTWDGPEINTLRADQEIIVVGIPNEDLINDVRTLKVTQE